MDYLGDTNYKSRKNISKTNPGDWLLNVYLFNFLALTLLISRFQASCANKTHNWIIISMIILLATSALSQWNTKLDCLSDYSFHISIIISREQGPKIGKKCVNDAFSSLQAYSTLFYSVSVFVIMAQVTKTVVKTQGGAGSSQYGASKATGIELFLLYGFVYI